MEPNPFRFVIYGAGWIGSLIKAHLEQLGDSVVFGQARADDDRALGRELDALAPTHVISALGRTHGPGVPNIDYLEGRLELNLRDNLYAPLNLARHCRAKGLHLSYIGTGCIFEYDAEHREPPEGLDPEQPESAHYVGFTEADNANFFGSSYSVVKGYTDRLLRQYDDCVLNLRIRMPISRVDNSRNFVSKIAHYPRLVNIQNSMTVLEDWVPAFAELAKSGVTGTLNATNPGTISHNEIMRLYREFVDLSAHWENFTVEEQNAILKSRRSNNKLETGRLADLVQRGILTPIPDIRASVRRTLKNWIRAEGDA